MKSWFFFDFGDQNPLEFFSGVIWLGIILVVQLEEYGYSFCSEKSTIIGFEHH